ncbi:MAG: heme exporter protein CcmD [Actinomycetes bacterium]
MSNWGYVALAFGLTAVTLVGYCAWILVRGRTLSRRLPPSLRRWS